MDNLQISHLDNGLTVVSDFIPYIETVMVGVMASVGSINESLEINGISHFLEHMAFKGTTSRSYTDIAEIIEDIGGDINAYTSKDHTFFYTKLLKEYLEIGIDILSDIIQNSIFDQTETDKERNVILQELFNSLDTPDDIIYDYFIDTAYPNQPMGRPILGSQDSIKSISPQLLKNYIHDNYSSNRLYLIVSGNAKHEDVVKFANIYFNNLTPPKISTPVNSSYHGGAISKFKDLEQVHFMLGFQSSNLQNRTNLFKESILNSILGGGMSSRLFQQIREKLNLVYTIYSSMSNFDDTGFFYIYSCSDPFKINNVIDASINQILSICENGISQKELDRAKVNYKAGLLMTLENPSSRMRLIGRQLQHYNRIIPNKESFEILQDISLNDIREFAQSIFSSRPTIASVGKVDNIYDFDTISSKLSK